MCAQLQDILQDISDKKARLDGYRPLPPVLARDLNDWFRIELAYASNALEGNSLTRSETELVVQKGITTGGKSLREHLEAVNHADAFDYVKALASDRIRSISRHDILSLHNLLHKRIDDDNSGRLRITNVKVAGTEVVPPDHSQVSRLMEEFVRWLNQPSEKHLPTFVADAHLKFVSIHPFVEGDNKIGRLLMNVLLMRYNYPPALIRKEDREDYLGSIEEVQLMGRTENYYQVMYKSIERSFDTYLEPLEPKDESIRQVEGADAKLLRIGELARETGENTHTIRYWTNEGLLTIASRTAGGYQLYERAMVEQAKKVRQMQQQVRLTIAEIRNELEEQGDE